jgi:hypothetical protein
MNEKLLNLLGGKEELYPHFIEEHFPRVFQKIVELWETENIDSYLSDLIVDKRSDHRQGFPEEAVHEIFLISNYFTTLHGLGRTSGAWDDVPDYKRHEIERFGYDFSPHGLLKSVEDGNRAAVGTFLSCGVDLEVRDERDWTPLMIAAFNGNGEFALLLIKCGAKVMTYDKTGYTPLHWAAFSGYDNVVKLLIEKNAEVNATSEFGWTALMQAATRGHLLICAYLIAAGADVNIASADGWTALHKASNNGHTEVVKFLLAKGADRYAQYKGGVTSFDLASKAGHQQIIALLNPAHERSV